MAAAPANTTPPSTTKTPNAGKPVWTFSDYVNYVIFLVSTAAAIYYGWTLGRSHALPYWMVVQSLGQVLGDYARRIIAGAQEYVRRSR
jgi:hypothetical protein